MPRPLQIPAQVEVVSRRYVLACIGKPPPEVREDLFVAKGNILQLGLTATLATLVGSPARVSTNKVGEGEVGEGRGKERGGEGRGEGGGGKGE